jgi:hypothetical protein
MVDLYRGTLAVVDIAHNLDSSGDKVLDTAELQQIESNVQPLQLSSHTWNALQSPLKQLKASNAFPRKLVALIAHIS